MNILLVFLKDWKNIVGLVLVITLVITFGMFKYEINKNEKLTKENIELGVKLKVKDSEISRLLYSIKIQNKAVEDLNDKLNNKQKDLDELSNHLAEEKKKHEEKILNLFIKKVNTKDIFITTPCGDKINRKDASEEANELWKNIISKW